jgi:hypothetical protein
MAAAARGVGLRLPESEDARDNGVQSPQRPPTPISQTAVKTPATDSISPI